MMFLDIKILLSSRFVKFVLCIFFIMHVNSIMRDRDKHILVFYSQNNINSCIELDLIM
jgi:hypothetical protein